jgi:hypothetical protein
MLDVMVILIFFLIFTAVFSKTRILELNLPAEVPQELEPIKELELEVIIRKDVLEVADRKTGLLQAFKVDAAGYDLKALGISSVRTGWFQPTPQVRLTTQLAVGLLTGLLIAAAMRSRWAPRITDSWVRSRRAWGPALTGAIILSAACLASVLMILTGVWLTPLTFLSAGAVVVLAQHRAIARLVRRSIARVPRTAVRTAGLTAVPLAVIVAVAVGDAAAQNVIKVRQILEDPAAVHISANGGRG